MPSWQGMAQEAIGLGERSISTRHIRQFAGTDNRSWKQKRGISMPSRSQACSTEVPGSTSISISSMVITGIVRPRSDRREMDLRQQAYSAATLAARSRY